jgi:3-dehydroquinate synthase
LKSIHDLTYPIYFEDTTLNSLNDYIFKHTQNKSIYVITDQEVYDLHRIELSATVPTIKGYVIIQVGEASKSLHTYEYVMSQLLEKGIKKDDVVLAFGGGVVGDLAGFVAATLFRGVDFIQVPTSLLAQVDSSVGSKVGINSIYGKNLIGSFKEPIFVYIYSKYLNTLNKREFNNGMAEIIKAGLIGDATLIRDLFEDKPILEVIQKAIVVKVNVVKKDPFESHERKILNFGHTLGHAIEKRFEYREIKHGEAISHGMIFALKLGIHLGITPVDILDKVEQLLNKFELLKVDILPYSTYIKDVKFDKKNHRHGIDMILLTDLGKGTIHTMDISELYEY